MEIRFAQFPMAATRAHGVLLRRRADAGVGASPLLRPSRGQRLSWRCGNLLHRPDASRCGGHLTARWLAEEPWVTRQSSLKGNVG